MIYNLYCATHRDYALHSILDDDKGEIQTIKCLSCGHEQKRVILGRRVSISQPFYAAYQEQQK